MYVHLILIERIVRPYEKMESYEKNAFKGNKDM